MLDTILELLERDPFAPFRLVTTSGDKYDVTNPHVVAIGESTIFCAFPKSDRWAWLRINQIVAVETVQAAA